MVNIRARTTDEHIKNIRKTMTDPFNLVNLLSNYLTLKDGRKVMMMKPL